MSQYFVRRPKRKLSSEINVVPYIDVMLVLLVIFMVTAPFLQQGVTINLPKVSSDSLPQNPNNSIATISLTATGTYYVNFSNEVVTAHSSSSHNASTLTEVISQISSKNSNHLQVFIRADGNVAYAKAVELIAALQQAGISQVGLITETP